MFGGFRGAMTWLHTWFGLVLGYVLVVVFFFGALSVFDREFDRWGLPQTRFAPQPMPSYDRMLAPIFAGMQPEADDVDAARGRVKTLPATWVPREWSAYTTHRDPVVEVYAEYALPGNPDDPDDHVHGHVTVDPRTGRELPHGELKIGSEFFYPMHIGLNLTWKDVGYWIVGLAAMAMLVALVSGVVIHRRIFREFFTFRPRKALQRSILDLHNLTGVVALPFHFFFALTGLTIFASMYFPVGETLLKPQAEAAAMAEAAQKNVAFKPAGVAAPLASVDAMVVEAKRRWNARGMPGDVGYLEVSHVGDRNAYVTVYRAGTDRVALLGQPVIFEGTTGRVLYEEPAPSSVESVNDFLTGLHLQQFEHWPMRWLYVLGGLMGATCIATGFVFFVRKRRAAHAARGIGGARWADAMAVATVTGTLIATLALMIANRLLPEGLAHRGTWQQAAFFAAWVVAFAHAAWRTGDGAALSPAWATQARGVAVLAIVAVLANWITTGDHLGRTLAARYWPVAGIDLSLLVVAVIAFVAARRIGRRAPEARASAAGATPATQA